MLTATTLLVLVIIAYFVIVGAVQDRSRTSGRNRTPNGADAESNTSPKEGSGENDFAAT